MQREVREEYKRLRDLGFTAEWALHDARSNVRFEELEQRGFVRLRVEPDLDSDIDDLVGDHATPHEIRTARRRIEEDGVTGLISEARCSCCKNWIIADSVWGFIGNDWKDSGDDTDLKRAALHEHTEEWILNQRRRHPLARVSGDQD